LFTGKKGKAFVFYVFKKSISHSHALLLLVDIPSNFPGIVANSSGIDKGLVNFLIHVSYLFQEEHVVPIQLIIIGSKHLVMVLEQFVLLF